MSLNLRRYPHLGKYEGELAIAPVLHELSQDGSDEEIGELETSGVYLLLKGPFRSEGPFADISATARLDHELNSDELAYLGRLAGVVIHETDNGFVYVEYAENASQLAYLWAAAKSAVSQYDDPEE